MTKSEQIQEELKKLKVERIKLLEQQKKYEQDNKIEFFKPPPPNYIVPTTAEDIRKVKDKYQNPKQVALFKAWKNPYYRKITYTGANRTGKTTSLVCLAFSSMFGYYPWDPFRESLPSPVPCKVLLVGQIWGENIKKVIQRKMNDWWPKKRLVKTSRKDGVDSEWVDEQTGSYLTILSNEQNRDAFESSDFDVVLWDEPPKHENWIAANRGLVDRGGREFFASTLLNEQFWFYREVMKKINKDGTPDRTILNIHAEMRDNVGYGLVLKDVENYENSLPEDEKQARIYGIPTFLQGLVLPQFKRDIHLVPRFKQGIPTDWIVDILIDVHPRERQAVLFGATNQRNERYIIEEIWEHGDGTFIGHEIIKRIKRGGYRVGTIAIDPLSKSDSNNQNTTFEKIDNILFKHGYMLEVASKDKDSGILAIKEHLYGLNEKPSLWIFDDLIRTIYEIEGWMYDKDTQKPIKKDDHMMENLYRWLLMDTKWYEMNEEPEEHRYSYHKKRDGINPITGY